MNTNVFRRRVREEDGQSLVEFALALPLLVLLLFGVIQFGIVFNHYLALTDAVRAGARKATVSRQTTDPLGPVDATKQAVISAAGDITIPPTSITVTSTWQAGSDVTVTAAYPYSINLFGVVVAAGDLHSTTTERVE